MRPTLLAIEAPLRDTGSMTSARGTTASTGAPGRPLRALFVNENLGGHASMHLYIRQALADVPELEGDFVDVPRAGWIRKLLAAPVPGLATHDLDLQPLRAQLLQSMWVRQLLARAARSYDVVTTDW